jgi:hypothetical protein
LPSSEGCLGYSLGKRDATVTTHYIGNCQICERDQKLREERLVLHGYLRPGWGHVNGQCPGVGHAAYEHSCEALKAYKAQTEEDLIIVQKHLADLEAGTVTRLVKYERHRGSRDELVEYVCGVTEYYQWIRRVDIEKYETKVRADRIGFEIARCVQRIAKWTKKDIRTVKESVKQYKTFNVTIRSCGKESVHTVNAYTERGARGQFRGHAYVVRVEETS